MEVKELLKALTVVERLKDTTRHCYTSKGRRESVAEHSWMMTLMAFFMKIDISTWSENEFTWNLTYADDRVSFSQYLSVLREEIRKETIHKISGGYNV